MADASAIKSHDIAAGEIHGWRGRCLDLFARGERVIDTALEAVCDRQDDLSMKHLAGQRSADLAKYVAAEAGATEKQTKAALDSLDAWQAATCQRAFFAHGVVTPLLDRHGDWHVQLDFTRYQAKRRDRQRWTVSKDEAIRFEQDLARELQALSAQLGQLRKRLSS